MSTKRPLGITDVVLRDAHQSLLATRMRVEDMLPIAGKLDEVGFWSIESWGGATFDACIRYLGEDPWERMRKLKAAMPNTPPMVSTMPSVVLSQAVEKRSWYSRSPATIVSTARICMIRGKRRESTPFITAPPPGPAAATDGVTKTAIAIAPPAHRIPHSR